MKLVTFNKSSDGETYRLGALVSENEVVDLTSLASNESLSAAGLLKCFDLESGFLEKAKTAISDGRLPRLNRFRIEICAPVPRAPKIICIGLNYRDHATESGMDIPKSPIIFSKFSSCAVGAGEEHVTFRAADVTDHVPRRCRGAPCPDEHGA